MIYKALAEYNFYDGPVMLTASAPDEDYPNINNIFWLVWEEELEDYSRTYRAYQLTGLDELQVGKLVGVVHESQIDWSDYNRSW